MLLELNIINKDKKLLIQSLYLFGDKMLAAINDAGCSTWTHQI